MARGAWWNKQHRAAVVGAVCNRDQSRLKSAPTIIVLLLLSLPVAHAELTGRDVVIVCNTNEPASRALADEYAQLRAVPTNQICALACRVAETITRGEFNTGLRDPLRDFLKQTGLQPTVLVLLYGVPLRIEADPSLVEKGFTGPKEMNRNEASVDSELATLPSAGLPVTGPLPNPFFRHGKLEFPATLRGQMLLVGRLDGPSPATVRRMMADALATERAGLRGRAYVDARGIRDGGYAAGDAWLRTAATALREAGYDCELDDRPELLAAIFPMTDAAIYAGWYAGQATGPMMQPGFRFRPGAVAVHIHSSSAASLRTKTSYWAGPLLEQGAAATVGNVFEPYLALTPQLDEFFRRLLAGATFIEAAWASTPAVSWQTTMVGDPLYRPLARPVDEQIAAGGTDVEWAYVRKVNLLVDRLDDALAEKLCREQAAALRSAALQEKLGDLLLAQKRVAGAIEAWEQALTLPGVCVQRVALKLARAYEATGQLEKAKLWQARVDELLQKK